MALQKRDVPRLQTRNLISRPNSLLLAGFGGRQQSGRAAIVADADSANHGENAIARSFGIGQALEYDEAGAFGGQKPSAP